MTEASEPAREEVLSRNTARLSISVDNQTGQFADHVSQIQRIQRDSAIDGDNPETNIPVNSKSMSKRRRSSAASSIQPMPKKPKEHKRKMRKAMEPLTIRVEPQRKPIDLVQIRSFILDILTAGPPKKKQSLGVSDPKKVSKVVFIFVPGLVQSDFQTETPKGSDYTLNIDESSPKHSLPFFYKTFQNLFINMMSGGKDSMFSCHRALVSYRVSNSEKQARMAESRNTKIVLYDLLLNLDQMKQQNFPIHSSLDPESSIPDGWVETQKFEHEGSHTFAMDCEFCQSASGKVLTRVSLVNFQGEVMYDTLVKPKEEITDYVTKYSGITEEMLKDVTTTHADVQAKLLEIISSDDILIGHSLESDLNVLQIRHPNIVDTSVIYDHERGPPLKPKLLWLANVHLSRLIQQGESTGKGHSSVEDLIACLDLVKMKLIEGPMFGKQLRDTSIFELLHKADPEIKSTIVDINPSIYGADLGTDINLAKFTAPNDDEVADVIGREIESSKLVFGRMTELEFNSGQAAVPSSFTGQLHSELDETRRTDTLSEESRQEYLLRLNDRLQKVYNALPEGSVLVVSNEGNSKKRMIELQKIRWSFQQLERNQVNVADIPPEQCWDFDKRDELFEATKEARNGLVFFAVKTAAPSPLESLESPVE